MDSRIARPLLGLIAGTFTVLLVDRFILPDTLVHGFIGVLTAVLVLGVTNRQA
jgi:hypothetical protein